MGVEEFGLSGKILSELQPQVSADGQRKHHFPTLAGQRCSRFRERDNGSRSGVHGGLDLEVRPRLLGELAGETTGRRVPSGAGYRWHGGTLRAEKI